jgi:hypothetical protein
MDLVSAKARRTAAALLLACAAGCASLSDGRCHVSEPEYEFAFDLFTRTGSIDLVRRELTGLEWERCKVNEVVYRLEKETYVERVVVPPRRVESESSNESASIIHFLSPSLVAR